MVSARFQPDSNLIPTLFGRDLGPGRRCDAIRGARERWSKDVAVSIDTATAFSEVRCNGWGVNFNSSSTRCKLSQLLSMAAEV